MFRCHFELTAYMILYKFSEKCIILIGYKIVESYSGTYKYFFYSIYFSELSQQLEIFFMIYFHIRTWFRKKTLPVHTRTLCALLCTCWLTEICSRTTYIVYIPLELGVFYHLLCLFYHALITS